MRNLRVLLPLILVCLMGLFYLFPWKVSGKLTPELTRESAYAIGNNATLLTGCKVLARSAPRKIIYEPVVKRFINLPCALEVPPPFSAIEFKKRSRVY